ncbi:MAG: HlyD family efflux transporter periplasmic adaptor subunit [Lachnospiraceae bacterium]|nr:HlyD family efflux transporter periplasmic adaptor subunit [Lachnospiraceae bacterium]
MNDQTRKKRDWIKNAAIVFLAVMLVLTFFSNTIMNHSLPEVSAQYVTSGSIQAKVRGSGTITAGDPYMVKAESTRDIASVLVRNGDHVEKGDVLIYLEEGDSTELKEAQKTLEQLLDSYRKSALAAEIDPVTTNKILSGQFTDFNTYKSQIDALKNEIKALEDHIALYVAEIKNVEEHKANAEKEGSADSIVKRQEYEASMANRQQAEVGLENAGKAAEVAVYDAENKLDVAKTVEGANAKLSEANQKVTGALAAVNSITSGDVYKQAEAMRRGYETALETAKANLESATAAGDEAAKAAAQQAWTDAQTALTNHMNNPVYGDLSKAQGDLEAAQKEQAKYQAVADASVTLENAKAAEKTALNAYEIAGPDRSGAIAQYNEVIRINQEYVNEQNGILSEKQSALNALLTQMSQESALSAQLAQINEQKALIAKLNGGSEEASIIAPVSGTVQDLYLTAGESTTAGNAVATILPDGKGFTMEVTVTKEQAQRLSVGDIADIQNSWYYSNVTAVLKQIKADRSNPQANKVLVFTVEGDVSDGQNLNISIGQKSANYDYIVPNSAIREDNNGKFILIVSQKSSPLGNRYYAERVDVEVLGSDDTQSAVKGALYGYEFVITTSTKPVEAGQLIRLPD